MTAPRRIVCYAVNGSGLGHVTRLVAVARWLVRLDTFLTGVAPEVLFLTSTEATEVITGAQFAAFKLPSKGTARASGLDVLEHRRLAKHFVWQMLQVFAPDLLVVDTFPQGSFDELLPILDAPCKKALVLRRVKPEFAARPTFQAALRMYDRIVVPHAPGSIPTLVPHLPSDRPPSYAGEVLALDVQPVDSVATLRAELGVDGDAPLVFVSAGGGGDPEATPTLAKLVAAVQLAAPQAHVLIGAGPLYRGKRIGGARTTWCVESDVSRFFPACDAAIAAAGYNTFHELLHLGVPSAFFAQQKIADDQAERIRGAAVAGACLALRSLTPDDIARALTELVTPERARALRTAGRAWVPTNGARRAAAAILSAVHGAAALRAGEILTPRLVQALDALGPAGSALLRGPLRSVFLDTELVADSGREALEPLLARLSEPAQSEVRELLRTQSDAVPLEDELVDLCAAGAAEPELLAPLLEAALRKHPLAQEADRKVEPWLKALLDGVRALLTTPIAGLATRDLVTLYRSFPRVADASAAESFDLFRRFVASGGSAPRVQALKLGARRIVKAHLEPLVPREEA